MSFKAELSNKNCTKNRLVPKKDEDLSVLKTIHKLMMPQHAPPEVNPEWSKLKTCELKAGSCLDMRADGAAPNVMVILACGSCHHRMKV